MLRASIVFFIIGLVAIALGANGVASVSLEAGRLLLFVFLALAVLSFLGGILSGRSSKTPLSVLVALFMTGAFALTHSLPMAKAGETASEKVENAAGDAKTKTKKTGRKAKKKVRSATDNENVTSDVKESAENAGDDLSNSAKKMKRKAD